MMDPVRAWLDGISADSGLLACGVRHPQGACVNQSFTPNYPSDQLNEVWAQLFEAVRAFQLRRIPLERLCWKLERAQVWFVLRRDGLGLGLVFKPAEPGSQAPAKRILEDFLRQDWRLAA